MMLWRTPLNAIWKRGLIVYNCQYETFFRTFSTKCFFLDFFYLSLHHRYENDLKVD